jgi:amino acid adenylation domain-containing protein
VLVVQNDEHEWGSQLGLTDAKVDRQQRHPHAINLQCILKKSSILLEANYDDQTVSRVSMNRILQQLERLLTLLNETSLTSTIQSLNVVSAADLKLIAEYNASIPPATEECVHRMIEERVRTEPNAAAVCAWDGILTYQELDERSTRLAKHIRTVYTLKPDDIILLLYEKSMWAVVSMYTTLKAGCAYAFLGIQDPVERHSQLIASTRSRLVLTSTALAGAMAFHEISHLTVDEELMHSLPAMESSFQSDVHPHNLAFLVFSSGSTGVPKAAMIEHMSAATSAIAHGTREGLNTASRVYQFASYSFDISTGDMLTTLIFGGCVCIPSEDQRLGDLAGSMKALGINRACLTPTVASLLKPEDVPGLKILKLGGEALTHANVAAWAGKVHLINGYGPCEASIWSSYRTDISIQTDPSNCGSAVGCALWIANPEDYNKLIPLGAIGELLIEGPTLARGYFNDVERTIGAFVQPAFLREMFPERPGRVYRTGDLFRYASDGTIRFVGRKDSQVKVHGQRIELKEIESHIVSVCAGDGLGAVVYPKYGPFKGKLVAVLSFGNGLAQNGYVHILSENDKGLARVKFHHLETELLAALPPYMVPRVWIAVEALPVNPSGKLHRAVLTKWTESLSNAQKQQIRDTMDLSAEQNGLQSQPLSGSERTIQKIWAKVLGIPESGINADSNYFVLGGDSLSAMQIASLCRSEGLNLTMKDILGCKTLAKLALSASATLESPIYDIAKETSDTSTTFHLSAANFERLRQLPLFFGDCDPKLAVDDAFPATPMQRGIFLSRLKVLQSYNISIYLRVTSPSSKDGVDLNRLAEAWRRVVQRQPSLRTVFVNDARIHSGLLQIVIGGILTQSRQHYVADETEALRLHRQTQPCWDSNEPEQSIAFYQLPTGDVVCALDIAHTLTDAWSTDIIISDLAAAYDGLLPTDPAPSLRRLTEYLTDERRSSSIVYWKKYLQDSNPCIFPDLDVQPANSSHVDVDVSFPGLDFREFCTRTQTTPAVLFQAICALTLRVYSGWDDVVFGLLSSGRDIPIPDAENTLGAFITMLVGRFRFDARTTIQAQVQRLQRDYVEHLSYQFFPLADLQHALGLAGQPLFDTVLSVLAEPSATHTPKSGLRFDRIDQDGLTEYALVVNVDQSQEMLSATFTADLRRISEAQLHSIANTFSHIAFEMVAKQELQLGDINTISEIDRQHIDSWNSQCPEPLELCVNTLLQDQMVKNPDAPAIFACDGQLSYNELGRRSAAVAAHLIKLGLRPGSFVPFCFEHSMYAIVCIVGIIRAGLAAVPLDPSHPLTRLRLISSQVEAKVLLCSRQQLERCKDLAIEVVAAVEDVLDGNSLCTSTIEQVAVQPSDPVYVIFTSGSTVRKSWTTQPILKPPR